MKRIRKFYSVLVCSKGKDYCEDNLERIIDGNYFVFAYDVVQRGDYEEVGPGDILLLKYQDLFVAFAEVTIPYHQTKDKHWNQVIGTTPWILYDEDNRDSGINAYGIGWNTIGGSRGVVKELDPGWAFTKIKEIKPGHPLIQKISIAMSDIKEKSSIDTYCNLLTKLKPQLILQGPPGTGKTRLAQKIAAQLAQGEEIQDTMSIIDDYLINFNPAAIITKQDLEEDERIRNEFITRFPVSSLRQLTPEDYAIGTGNKNDFCYWIERGLTRLGKYSPGKASHYYLYWRKSDGEYKMSGALLNGAKDAFEAAERIGNTLADVVETSDIHKGDKYFGDSFLLKILNTYYPDDYFPINGDAALDAALSLFGVNGRSLSKLDKNKKFNELFLQKKKQLKSQATAFTFMRFLFSKFDLKNGVKIANRKVVREGKFQIVQFHPSFTYEDFVRGIVVRPNGNGLLYSAENKILAQFAEEALANESGNYVLILDEINRANLSSVLGELIYALEYRYDRNKPDENVVHGVYEVKQGEVPEPSRELRLPDNLYLIGTMNTADRSAGHIDYAIRRRFAFAQILPSSDPVHPQAKKLFREVSSLFIANFDAIESNNGILERSTFLSPDFDPEDVWIGHSYFITDTDDDENAIAQLQMKLRYEIIPLLYEYLKDGILTPTAKQKIDTLHEFLS